MILLNVNMLFYMPSDLSNCFRSENCDGMK